MKVVRKGKKNGKVRLMLVEDNRKKYITVSPELVDKIKSMNSIEEVLEFLASKEEKGISVEELVSKLVEEVAELREKVAMLTERVRKLERDNLESKEKVKKEDLRQLWEKFLKGENVLIQCKTERQAKKLLRYLGKLGYTWLGEKLSVRTNWDVYKNQTFYATNKLKRVMFGAVYKVDKDKYKILQFEDIEPFLKEEK